MIQFLKMSFSIFCLLLFCGCAAQVPTPDIAPVSLTTFTQSGSVRPAQYPTVEMHHGLRAVPVRPFQAGDKNALEFSVSQGLADAYRFYFEGEGEQALNALDGLDAASPLEAFHHSAQRVQTLIMMGRAAEAVEESEQTAALEIKAFGTDVNALALRAEALLWLSDYQAAEATASAVAKTLEPWILPSAYGGPPTNMAQIVLLTTAQLRAYTVLAGLYVLQGDATAALPWAEAAERGYDTYHAVADDPLYGMFLKPYPESYYGRAFNTLFLASARAISTRDFDAGEADFTAARSYFETIGYRAGHVAAAALESWTLYTLDQDRQRALNRAEAAVQLAIEAGFTDFVWRIDLLRGEILLKEGQRAEAEAAIRRADASVDLVSGALSTDRAKLRYGVGKETISYRLSQFGVASGDLDRLFHDLERARARAFVDMLADRVVAPGRYAHIVDEIKRLDREIRAVRIRAMAPRPTDATGNDRLSDLLTARAGLLDQLRRADPDLAAVHGVDATDLSRIRTQLDEGDVLLYTLPARGDDHLIFLIADRQGARLYETTLTASGLNRLITRFREAVTLKRPEPQERIARQIEQGLGLADWRGQGRTYIVPGGDLFFLPWGALPNVGETVVLPTGSWLLRQPVASLDRGVSLIGDPDFSGTLPQLNGARKEVIALGRQFGVAPLLDTAATRQALRTSVGSGVRLLHIATHGSFDAVNPMQSALAFSANGAADLVTAADLFKEPVPAALVVLSACDTGMGKSVAGNDFLGLARSFYLGGARGVVNSLWPIDDAGTMIYMQVFHESVQQDGNLARAWLAARDHLMAQGYPPSVYGAFVLGGTARL
jgi:hypothetical protein